jgi:hypothetical protein
VNDIIAGDSFPNNDPVDSTAALRFHKNAACEAAITQYMCWINFPRCDEFEESLPTCTSACENFFRVCGYSAAYQKCGTIGSEFIGKRPVQLNDSRTFAITDFFPGHPFKTNEFLPNSDVPKAVCTPSVKGVSNQVSSTTGILIFISSLAVLMCTSIL